MGRQRKPLQPFLRGRLYHTRFLHPIQGKTVSITLGGPDEARDNLEKLNTIFLNEAYWTNPPATTPASILRQWNRSNTITLKGHTATKSGKRVSIDADVDVDTLIASHPKLKKYVEKLVSDLALELAQSTARAEKLQECFATITKLEKELEHWKGKKLHKGPLPTLSEAKALFLRRYKGRDSNATQNISWDLERFVKKFGADTPADKLEGKERDINAWIRGLKRVTKANPIGTPLSPARRMQIRLYVLKMLEECGLPINRKLIDRPGKKETRQARGAIKYLSREDAEKVAQNLSEPWSSMFRVQCAIGLRPDELLTLHRDHFAPDLSAVDLQPLGSLSLKTGTRHIPIPATIRPTIQSKLDENEIVFPDVDTQKAWTDPKKFNRMYRRRLRKAAKDSNVSTPMDSRIGRRTCASLLVAQNVSADRIAKLLGNSPEMILEHYGERDVKGIQLEGVTTL